MTIKRLLCVIILSLFSGFVLSGQVLDSLTRHALSGKLDEYLSVIESSGVDVQKKEADFLIESASDSLVRQFVAVKVYNHYFTSNVMGAEAVAIHVLDKWFLDGNVKMYNDLDLLNARVFADFNRQSLIGQLAPSMELTTFNGDRIDLFSSAPGKLTVLYFYDADCAKCKLETALLNNYLSEEEWPVVFNAFYAGDNRERWEQYINENFQFDNIPVTHVWDPQLDSDFQRKYGVLQTPRMFLIAPDGTILGRGLDAQALIQMLNSLCRGEELVYGSKESVELFDQILGNDPSISDIEFTASVLVSSTLDKGRIRMYKQMIGDYMYYLASKPSEAYKEALAVLIHKYILDRSDIWNTADDQIKIVGFAEILNDLLAKSKPGSRIADIKVRGKLIKKGKIVTKRLSLGNLKGDTNIIIFHTEGCNICEAEIKAAFTLSENRKDVKILLVNVDNIISDSSTQSSYLFDSFDLSALPFIVQTDNKGLIQRRYITLLQ